MSEHHGHEPNTGCGRRIGLLIPSPNTVAETEFWRLAPAGLSVHSSRMPFFAERDAEPLETMASAVPRVLDEACTAEPDVIAYACTASSARPQPDRYQAHLSELAARPVFTAACALLDALRHWQATRIALLTPYPQAVNDKEKAFFAANGVQVMVDRSIIVDPAQQRLRHMCKVPPAVLLEQARDVVRTHAVDAIVLSCCDMRTLEVIAAIESATGKLVTSSNQALYWRTLQALALPPRAMNAGSLLA
ncbi:MAG: hypothetical protein KDK91_04155 [Gammaproteobacteria bacterium]|nr:hypothetical protein [Gammaproteobacteria bacterium]